jgi:RNA recognition motif-containing protein
VIKGIPFRIKNDEIIEFFSSCGSLSADKIYIDQVDGRKSGSALVIFENSDAV